MQGETSEEDERSTALYEILRLNMEKQKRRGNIESLESLMRRNYSFKKVGCHIYVTTGKLFFSPANDKRETFFT